MKQKHIEREREKYILYFIVVFGIIVFVDYKMRATVN